MELRIAKYLSGHRVPMSGAGSIKGDCMVITDKCGQVFIECKYSAGMSSGEPRIRIDFKWFPKMQRDAESMRSRFAALIFRYHDTRLSDYVIIPISVFERYDDAARLDDAAILNAGTKSGLDLKRSKLLAAFAGNIRGENICLLECKHGIYVIMTIDIFKEMIYDIPHSELA